MSDPLGLVSGSSGLSRDVSPARTDRAANTSGTFRSVLESEIAEVNQMQQDAKEAVEDLAAGRRDDLEGVIIATQKADTAFRMLLQVRNKVMDALEEIKQVRV